MADYVTDNCRSCDADIIWASTEKGSDMPLDAAPDADGTFTLRDVGADKPLAVHLRNPARRFGKTQLRKSHFATCPDADRWRKTRPAVARTAA